MAQKYITVKTSDLSGAELPEGAGETITFSLGRSAYVIDLSDNEVGAFYDALKPYTDAARKADSSATVSAARPKSTGPKQDLAAVRSWAGENGFTVSSRGRIPSAVLEAYDAAH